LAGTLILGFTWKKDTVLNEVCNNGKLKFDWKNLWYFSVKYFSPVLLAIVFLTSIGVI